MSNTNEKGGTVQPVTPKQTNDGHHAPLENFPQAFSTAILILLVAALVWGVL